MDTPDPVVADLLAAASANHDRLRRLEDVLASLSKAAETPAASVTATPATRASKSSHTSADVVASSPWHSVTVNPPVALQS
jgi:hypothetical protein